MEKLTVALDWTPNINHIGFFVAREKGFYREHGLEVELVDPSADNYAVTPAKKVETGVADIALCPTESVISYRTKAKPFGLKAIATIFQHDLSAIAVRSDQGISSPKDLDGKRYASYQARYEDGIVQQMIRNAGGTGNIEVGYPQKLGIWDTVLNGSYDATWIFLNWEGVEAEALGAQLTYFKMADYNIPYSYSPVLATDEQKIAAKPEVYQRFLAATRIGIAACHADPTEAASILQPYVPEKDRRIDLEKALHQSLNALGNPDTWGKMHEDTVAHFLNWIREHGLETTQLRTSDLMTNALIDPLVSNS